VPQATTNTLSTSRSSWSLKRCSSSTIRPLTKWPSRGVGHRGGLLGDLLEHEELVAALFGRGQVPIDMETPGVRVVRVPVEVGDPVAVGGEHDGLVLAEFDRLAGVFDERGHVGADEHLAVADP